jgi:hypothetical protein
VSLPSKIVVGFVGVSVGVSLLGHSDTAHHAGAGAAHLAAGMVLTAAVGALGGVPAWLYVRDRNDRLYARERAELDARVRDIRARAERADRLPTAGYDPAEPRTPWYCTLKALLPSGEAMKLHGGVVEAPESLDRLAVQAAVVDAFESAYGRPEGVAYTCHATPFVGDRMAV